MIEPKIDPSAAGKENGADTPTEPRTTAGAEVNEPAKDSGENLPNSRKVYVPGELHPGIRVPFREISLSPTKTFSGEIEVNEPVLVYDTSGPWTDPEFHGNVEQGLPPLRKKWIRDRGDVEEIDGRTVRPQDNGFLSERHAEAVVERRQEHPTSNVQRPTSNGNGAYGVQLKLSAIRSPQSAICNPIRARAGRCVTQLFYAREGIVTPEMEFIAIRENLKREIRNSNSEIRNKLEQSEILNLKTSIDRNSLSHQHAGNSFGANIPREITGDFVRVTQCPWRVSPSSGRILIEHRRER